MRKPGKKTAIVVGAALAASSGGVAYAYWTATGTGTGSAGAAASTTVVTVNQTSTVSGLAPGTAAQPLSGTFTNLNPGKVRVGQVTASVTGTDKAGCDATDFTITVQPTATNAEIDPGTGGSWGGGLIAFNDKPGAIQDACQGATVTLHYTLS